jgi:CubicO group peptidase (beta-lactamase class C family)
MKRIATFFLLQCFLFSAATSQSLYFPPLSGDTWETTAPAELGWCQEELDTMIQFLDDTNSKAFLVLKDGKIVVEEYFNNFTRDSFWYWASAGKTVTAFMTGLAQEQGFLDIHDPTSDYLGEGWTAAPPDKEAQITVWHQLTMTSGLDDGVENVDCTLDTCLVYLSDAGTRWAYHNAPYTLLDDVVAAATGQNYNLYLNAQLHQKIGSEGAFIPLGFNNVLFSRPRSMARFGLLMLNNGSWEDMPVMTDMIYFNAMINTSQDLNQSYGYLWWLNGKESFMLPGFQTVFNFSLTPEAPADMYAAVGKNGQIINVVPSMNLVLVRMGDSPGTAVPVPAVYNNEIWSFFNAVLDCTPTSTQVASGGEAPQIFPNPVSDFINIQMPRAAAFEVQLWSSHGRIVRQASNEEQLSLKGLPAGMYILQVSQEGKSWVEKVFKTP